MAKIRNSKLQASSSPCSPRPQPPPSFSRVPRTKMGLIWSNFDKMPPKNKTRRLSFVTQVDNQAQKNVSKNPNIGTSKGH
ncbi:hypothetical protein Taro_019452 [Colocasia esculenta]|uniref:Uncharacterized protein n=1 Tax=Colocasia esculenta TaxID=4460 RepID=A0A843UL44_COLES|nr:hypothetical protein [Colocasia esculenta]